MIWWCLDAVLAKTDVVIQPSSPVKYEPVDSPLRNWFFPNKKAAAKLGGEVYKVAVTSDGCAYFIFRRYAEFSKLNEMLKKQFPERRSQTARQEILWNNFDPSFIRHRREGLNDFIQKLVSSRADVKAFLQLDNPRNTELIPVRTTRRQTRRQPNESKHLFDLGQTENTQVKPSEFEFLKVIGKGSFGKLKKQFPDAGLKLPGKKFFGNNFDPSFIRHRREGLNDFIQKLVSSPVLFNNADVKAFLQLDNPRNTELIPVEDDAPADDDVNHVYKVAVTSDGCAYFIFRRYAEFSKLNEMLFFHLQKDRYFSEPRAKFYAAEIASAIGYLHSLNIIYRDLKPENILLDSKGHVVLTDFGLCKENLEQDSTTSTFCGTPEYLAPEVLKKQAYDRTVDWWCLGAVTYEMVYGLPPFYSRDTAEMYNNILHKPLQLRSNVSVEGRGLLEELLQKDKTKRLGHSNDFKDVKSHAWFADLNWEDLEAKKISPPYNPNVKDLMDLRHFDPEFVREPVPQSVGASAGHLTHISASVQEADEAFMGFSYAPPAEDAFL
ncbi:PREDICTED: serine/threonine-protein kinase Sgk1-like [Priapulus caudatus]|uniref:Serine/threonine-protein kinase Sgk1-like n=1 Tax=Priapulus caudatus TaxID=37621 RepID=A0ABM1DV70_PRICU|nr:PREDICTED: serine/threonine-protein kinase Sgk1-like [Priapulus caudatus]